jgi:Protein of unknown function (DUF3631)
MMRHKQPTWAVMDEVSNFIRYLMWMPDEYADAMSLILAVSHARDAFTSVPLALVTSDKPKTGKTTLGVKVPLMLAERAFKVNKATTEPAMMMSFTDSEGTPNWVVDDSGQLFGRAGRSGMQSKAYGIMIDAYTDLATVKMSVNAVSTDYPAYMVCFINGLNNAVPSDLRTRCVEFRLRMKPPEIRMPNASSPAVRNEAEDLKEALHGWARASVRQMREYMNDGVLHVHRLLTDRLMEIWGPMFAVADAAGGDWPQRCMEAFLLMGLDSAERPAVFGYQQALLDTAKVVAAAKTPPTVIFTAELVPALRALPEGDRYRDADNDYLVKNLLLRALGKAENRTGRSMAGQKVQGLGWSSAPVLEAAAALRDQLYPVPEPAGPSPVQQALTLTAVR